MPAVLQEVLFTPGVALSLAGPEGADRALDQPHVRPMDFTAGL